MTQAPQAMPQQTALICTLGTAPAVVTVTLDHLIERKGCRYFDEIVVLYTRQVSAALAALQEALQDARYRDHVRLPLRAVSLERNHVEIDDVRTEEDAESILRTLYRTVEQQKRLGRQVHLNASGGRKGIMLFAMTAAQMLFEPSDRLWLLWSSNAFIAGGGLHDDLFTQTDIISVPVLSWRNPRAPTLADLILAPGTDPIELIYRQRMSAQEEEFAFLAAFLRELPEKEALIAESIVRHSDLTDEELAREMKYSVKNIRNYADKVRARFTDYVLIRVARGERLPFSANPITRKELIRREKFIALFAPYFAWFDRIHGR